MPKETFFNLPADKRERLVEVALDELSRCSYDNASVSRMVAAAEIAKGSFYQYFEDKLDLFGWLIEEAGRRRSAWFASLPVPAPADPFDRLRFAYREGLGFWRAEPRWSRVGLRLWEPSEDPRFAARRAHAEGLVHRFLVDLLRDGQERGYVRADLDVEAGAWLVSGLLQEGLLRAFFASLGSSMERWPEDAERVTDDQLRSAMASAELAVDLLQAAVGVSPRAGVAQARA